MSNGDGSASAAAEAAWNETSGANGDSVTSICDLVSKVSGALGALGPIGSAVGAVIGIVTTVIKLGQPDPLQTALTNVVTSIQQVLLKLAAQLNKDLHVWEMLQRNSDLERAIGPGLNRLENINAYIKDGGPDPSANIDQIISDCTQALTNLEGAVSPDLLWYMNYDWQTWWTDAGMHTNMCYFAAGDWQSSGGFDCGYGTRSVPNTDGTVFVHTYSLPAYLSAIYCLLAVGGSLDPQFTSKYADRLAIARNQLAKVHSKIVTEGIVSLLPNNWTQAGTGLWAVACGNCNGPNAPQPGPGMTLIYGPVDLHRSLPQVLGVQIEYGAVERFSGCSSIGSNYTIDATNAADGNGTDPAIYNKLRLRCAKRQKDVYVVTGMHKVWQVIAQLTQLVGDAFVIGPCSADWSFRTDVLDLLQVAPINMSHSLRGLAKAMIKTQPLDTPYTNAPPGTPISWRRLLAEFQN